MHDPIERFEVKVRYGAITGRLVIDDFIEEFKAMAPSLHRLCNDEEVVDVGALIYCTERLPEEIYHIREVLVQADIPDKLPGMTGITEITTHARRRSAFDIGDDTVIVVAREGVTELLDLISLLVSFSIEAKKIVALLADDPLIAELKDPATDGDLTRRNRCMARLAFCLGVTDDLIMELDGYWEQKLLSRLRHLLEHPPSLVVRLHKGYSLESIQGRSKGWASRIAEHVQTCANKHGPLHVISSNLHSCVNLLSGFAQHHSEEIWKFAESRADFQKWDGKQPCRENLLYFFMKDWLKQNPERQREKQEFETSRGIKKLEDIHHLGIDAQVVDCTRLEPSELDPRLHVVAHKLKEERPLLINFDYAFGDQAGIVLDYLLRQFAGQVASFSIMGKAGTVVGDRGGVMLPTYLLKQGSDDVYDFPVDNILDPLDFEGLYSGAIHTDGPMLTVLGTVLQNDEMLRRYRDDWGILGLEMEGIPYVRSLHQNRKRGLMRDDFKIGVAYYASDAPLIPGESLSRELAFEGLDATYGISVALLNALLGTNEHKAARIMLQELG